MLTTWMNKLHSLNDHAPPPKIKNTSSILVFLGDANSPKTGTYYSKSCQPPPPKIKTIHLPIIPALLSVSIHQKHAPLIQKLCQLILLDILRILVTRDEWTLLVLQLSGSCRLLFAPLLLFKFVSCAGSFLVAQSSR